MKKDVLKGIIRGLAIVLFFSCGKSGTNDPYSNNPSSSTSDKVSIANMSFVAATTNVNSGTTVTWTNNDDVSHTVTADDNSFTSGNLKKGDTYSHTFNTPGTTAYHCAIHSGMKGSVVVAY